MENTLPPGIVVEIIDFDDIEEGDDFPSKEARDYCAERGLYEPPRALLR
jgi:hypothetical protein